MTGRRRKGGGAYWTVKHAWRYRTDPDGPWALAETLADIRTDVGLNGTPAEVQRRLPRDNGWAPFARVEPVGGRGVVRKVSTKG